MKAMKHQARTAPMDSFEDWRSRRLFSGEERLPLLRTVSGTRRDRPAALKPSARIFHRLRLAEVKAQLRAQRRDLESKG